ncbi:MAG: hypothetical protein KDC24_12040 [Saprospiraceae bacterium]|nr:hypothetical protein [Saprospiraceae bacterium]
MFYNLGIGTVILRFYLMMAVVIIAGFTGHWWLSLLALPIMLSIMTGYSFKKNTEEKH